MRIFDIYFICYMDETLLLKNLLDPQLVEHFQGLYANPNFFNAVITIDTAHWPELEECIPQMLHYKRADDPSYISKKLYPYYLNIFKHIFKVFSVMITYGLVYSGKGTRTFFGKPV